jgi:inosine-uridine nucleoside N-ribohydrolase
MAVGIDIANEATIGNTFERTDGSPAQANVMFDVERDRFLELLITSWCSL